MLKEDIFQETNLSKSAIRIIETVKRNIQLIADLSYADILIYCQAPNKGLVIVAAAKPNTSTSLYRESQVGQFISECAFVSTAFRTGKRQVIEQQKVNNFIVRLEAIPIKHDKQVVAVMTREQIQRGKRPLSEMELMYMSAADELIRMVEEGLIDVELTFPSAKEAGDGLLKVDNRGVITYASPNAVMIYKRLGEQVLVGRHVDELELNEMPIKMALQEGKASESEITERGLTILKRAIPLLTKSKVKGAIAIVRDVSDIRAREQQLRIKEATIKEIHHRVKNNLQTIASLLRLQARRLSIPEAREALLESVGRISSIAAVHEVLSQTGGGKLDFIGIVENIITMVEKSLIRPDKDIEIKVMGESGLIPAPVAASLALITTELLQNAVEHAFKKKHRGRITIEFKRKRGELSVRVSDNGVGLPPNFKVSTSSNLGLQIVETLVCEELHGRWRIKSQNGTQVVINIPISKSGVIREA